MKVVCFGAMREYLPDPNENNAFVELSAAATIEDLLASLDAPVRLVHVCLVDGRRAELTEELQEGSEVTLMPPFSGGA